jgi:redox-sensitive bicupin YhaK (pirin superfamily)
MKRIRRLVQNVQPHWVGDGFPVRSLFFYGQNAQEISPFLLLDYGGPYDFPPTDKQLGVDEHPHRGFETVTIVYEGGLEHRDSSGSHGKIGPGDVQWMTAASGVVHSEFHSREFAKNGGRFHMVQLWVNLPAAQKMSTPRYQEILDAQVPHVPIDGGYARVIAGSWNGTIGPARTVTPLSVVDLRLKAGSKFTAPAPDGQTAILLVQNGSVTVAGKTLKDGELAIFDRDGEGLDVSVEQDSMALLLTGEPINEPVVGQGPFVMNTAEEIGQAIHDYRSGKMGHLD